MKYWFCTKSDLVGPKFLYLKFIEGDPKQNECLIVRLLPPLHVIYVTTG